MVVAVTNGESVVTANGASHGDVILSKLPTLEGETNCLNQEDCLFVNVNNMIQYQLLGVKTLFSNTVWGVPYAKVE